MTPACASDFRRVIWLPSCWIDLQIKELLLESI
jgi:hypothetical protein